jgi:hypothetical protein
VHFIMTIRILLLFLFLGVIGAVLGWEAMGSLSVIVLGVIGICVGVTLLVDLGYWIVGIWTSKGEANR